MIDRGAPTHDALLPSIAERAAAALASTLGLGTDVRTVDRWPLEHGGAVVAADVTGGVVGTLVLAVNDAVAARLLQPDSGLTDAMAAAAATMTDALGVPVQIGAAASVGAVERPKAVTAVIDGGATTGLVGVSLDLGALGSADAGPELFDPSQLQTGAAHFERASFADEPWSPGPGRDPLSVLGNVEMIVTAELGRTKMPMRDLLALSPGMVVEIDRAAGAPIDLLVNGRRLATGEVVVIDEEFGIRITEILPADEGAR